MEEIDKQWDIIKQKLEKLQPNDMKMNEFEIFMKAQKKQIGNFGQVTILVPLLAISHIVPFKGMYIEDIKDWINQYEWASQVMDRTIEYRMLNYQCILKKLQSPGIYH